VTTSNTALASSAPTSTALTATSTSTKKATNPARSSNVRPAKRSFGAEKSDDDYWVTRGKRWTKAEIQVLKLGRLLKVAELQERLPGRSRAAILGKRRDLGINRHVPWTQGEDEELRIAAKRTGATGISRILPHRTAWAVIERSKALGVPLFNKHKQPLAIVGESLADAIRQRAREDGFSMRGLDCELCTGGYFTNVASQRAKRGSGPYMPAIRKAIEFFEAELITGPDGTITIDWKDE
jgi:hypothetical protein